MLKTLAIPALLLSLASTACTSSLFPAFALRAEGDALADMTAGTDYVVVRGGAGGALSVVAKTSADGAFVEAWRFPVGAGAVRAWHLTWGGLGGDGWLEIEPVPCATASAVYPWVTCPPNAGPMIKTDPVRIPIWVGRR